MKLFYKKLITLLYKINNIYHKILIVKFLNLNNYKKINILSSKMTIIISISKVILIQLYLK